jgi:predicted exporter
LQTAERLRGALQRWQADGDIGGFDLVSDYLPSAETQAARRAALPAPERLRADLDVALRGLPFRPATFDPFIHAVDEARRAAPLTPKLLQDTALGLKIGALLSSDDGGWHIVVPLARVRAPAAMAGLVAALGLPGVQWIDLRVETAAMLSAYRQQTLIYTAIGMLAIYVVLAFGLRSMRRAARVMLPVACALLLTAATLVAAGRPLTIFHLVALLLTLGIGINYALFFDSSTKLSNGRHGTLRTLGIVAGTTLSAFGALALSRTTVLQAIGTTVCLGVLFSLLATALMLSSPPEKAAGA